MKVTITIEGELTPEGIIAALAGAWTCGEFEMNGELYKGYKAFGYGPYEMTYTSEGEPVAWTRNGNMNEARIGAFYLTVSEDDFGRVVARVYGPHKSGASSSQAHCDSWDDAKTWAEQRAREETTD